MMAAKTCTCTDAPRGSSSSARLADHAATAALYVTDPGHKRAGSDTIEARPLEQTTKQLPARSLSDAGTAASLAHASRKKPIEAWWKPGAQLQLQDHAEKAALLARSTMSPEPQPAVVGNVHPEVYKAALIAARERLQTSPPPFERQQSFSATGGKEARDIDGSMQMHPGALTAATGATVRSRRRRAESAPSKPVAGSDTNTSAYALSAARRSHQASQGPITILEHLEPSVEAARIHNIARSNVRLYTSTPPVDIEVEEQRHRDKLRAAAVSMAKDMYSVLGTQEEQPNPTEKPFTTGTQQQRRSRPMSYYSEFSWTEGDEQIATRRPQTLHEAAQKRAADTLAKMDGEDRVAQQEYYGLPSSPRPTRLSLTQRFRRRTPSEGDISQLDWERSEEIRNQMSTLQSRLREVDEKRIRDREALMNIARRNVNAAIQDMDEQVYAKTGKLSPSMLREWEEQAHEKAKDDISAQLETTGKIPIGGDRYVTQADVEEVARARIQPTLDEITGRVEEQQAKIIEKRLDEERNQWLANLEREREKELHAEQRKVTREKKRPEQPGIIGILPKKSLSLTRKKQDTTAAQPRAEKKAQEPVAEVQPEQERAAEPTKARERDAAENAAEKPAEESKAERPEAAAARKQLAATQAPSAEQPSEATSSERPSSSGLVTANTNVSAGTEGSSSVVEPPVVISSTPPSQIATAATTTTTATATSPRTESRVKAWFKNRMSLGGGRRKSVTTATPAATAAAATVPPEAIDEEAERRRGAFVMTGTASSTPTPDFVSAVEDRRAPLASNPVTERDIAMATGADTGSTSRSASGSLPEEPSQLPPPPSMPAVERRSWSSGVRESRFSEDL